MKKATNKSYHLHIEAQEPLLNLRLGEVLLYRDLIFLYAKKNFVRRYKQTILGPAWLVINPLLTAFMNYIVFGRIAQIGTNGIPLLLFHIMGNAFWTVLSSITTQSSSTFSGNAYLFGKVYFPRIAIPLSNILVTFIEFLIQLAIGIAVSLYYLRNGIYSLFYPRLLFCLPIILWLACLGLGLGIIISSLTTKYRDLSILVGFGTRLWMYGTPVVYPLSQISSPVLRRVILLNPATAPIELFRRLVFGVGEVPPGNILYSILFSAAVLFLGLILFNRIERTFMDTV